MSHKKTLSLPSIQFLLSEEKKPKRHRHSSSISSLPSELQKITLSGPNIPQKTHRRSVSASTTISNAHEFIPFREPTPPLQLEEVLNLNKPKWVLDENKLVERDEKTGKYYCPFCEKPFNRPSSLRIHTYSHTGEKPFVCSENGCGRTFSVQSNMRRHLRVHKLGKSNK